MSTGVFFMVRKFREIPPRLLLFCTIACLVEGFGNIYLVYALPGWSVHRPGEYWTVSVLEILVGIVCLIEWFRRRKTVEREAVGKEGHVS